jgi:hypothetical protein
MVFLNAPVRTSVDTAGKQTDSEWQIRQNVNTRGCDLLWGAFYYFAKEYRGKSRKPSAITDSSRPEIRGPGVRDTKREWNPSVRNVPYILHKRPLANTNGGGFQIRACVPGTLIYEEANLRKMVRLVCFFFLHDATQIIVFKMFIFLFAPPTQ